MPIIAYAAVYLIPALFLGGVLGGGIWTWAVAVIIFGLIPIVEHFMPGTTRNVERSEERNRQTDALARFITYSLFPIQVVCSIAFLMTYDRWQPWELVGLIVGLGTIQGALGINGAHELGHHRQKMAKLTAKAMLIWSTYPHFLAEHNRGHHTRVATDDDPATAPRGQSVYAFWFQSLAGGVRSAFSLEAGRLKRKSPLLRLVKNDVLRGCLSAGFTLCVMAMVFGGWAAGAFLGASVFGILLLETVNYLQHYGLRRKRLGDGTYERVGPQHTWTSNHVLSRVLLLDLPRHADHHMHAGRYYANLRHHATSPVLPTGYPGLILMALVPPLFLGLMDRSLDHFYQEMKPSE